MITQYVIGYNNMLNLFFMLSDMAAMKFHIIFVGQAVALRHAMVFVVMASLAGIVQNVGGVKIRIGSV